MFSYSLLSIDSPTLALLIAAICGICFGLACWRQRPALAIIMACSSVLSGATAFVLLHCSMTQSFNAMIGNAALHSDPGIFAWLPLALFGCGISTIAYGLYKTSLIPNGIMPFRALAAMAIIGLGATLVLLSPQTGSQLAMLSGTPRDLDFWGILLFIAEHLHTALLVVLVPVMLFTVIYAFKRYRIQRHCYGYHVVPRSRPAFQY